MEEEERKGGRGFKGRQTLSCESNMLLLQQRFKRLLISAFDGVDPEEGSGVAESDDIGDGAYPVVFWCQHVLWRAEMGERAGHTFPRSPGVKGSW